MQVKEILMSIGYSGLNEVSGFYRVKPLYRTASSSSPLSINKNTGWFKDFGTDDEGPLYKLVSMSTGCSIDKAKEIVGGIGVHVDAEPINGIEMPIVFNSNEIKALLPSYYFYNKRGISTTTLETLQAGLATYGKMSDRFTFPIYNKKGVLVGLAGRDVTGKKEAKWKILGAKKNFDYPYYFNRNEIRATGEIILVESIGDMLKLWEAGVKNVLVLFGLALGKELMNTILMSCPKRVIVATNNDVADEDGRSRGREAAEKIRKYLLTWFSPESIIIKFPYENDFGDMTTDQILDWKKEIELKRV